MDAFALPVVIGCLAAGLLAGWFAASARAATRSARRHADLLARLAASDAARQGVQAQLDHQQLLYRELAAQARGEQAAREERERREQAVLRALAPVHETLQSMQSKVDDLERDRHTQFGTLAEQLRQAQRVGRSPARHDRVARGRPPLRQHPRRLGRDPAAARRRGGRAHAIHRLRHADVDHVGCRCRPSRHGDPPSRRQGDRRRRQGAPRRVPPGDAPSRSPRSATRARAARPSCDRHVKAVRSHIDALARKAYWAGLPTSPEFVVCFLPSESLLASALEEDPSLLDYAFGKRVALASPVNLWAVLKTVAYTWTQQDVSQEARALFELGNELYERLVEAGRARRRPAPGDRADGRQLQPVRRLARITRARLAHDASRGSTRRSSMRSRRPP